MSAQPTPETDTKKFWSDCGGWVVSESDCRNLERQRDELLEALDALSNCYCGSLEGVGGGTRIAPSMTVQLFKNARTAIANVKGGAR
jgi:hypothetical protein